MRGIRGNADRMIFQEPMTSLNPVQTVGAQIAEALLLHRSSRPRAARERAAELLELVGIPERASGCAAIRTTCPAACASA